MPEFFTEGQDARAYFVGRIRDQAKQENLQLTDFENQYLSLSEGGEDQAACDMLDAIKGKSFDEFDSRISGLLWRAYQQDLSAYGGAEECYENAIHALARVDNHPNLGMFVSCIALKTCPDELSKTSWWPTILIGAFLLLLTFWAFLHSSKP